MAQIGVSEAARIAGRDVSTLHRMMKAGRLAYSLDSQGRRRIDAAELARVFERVAEVQRNAQTRTALPQPDATQTVALLREALQCANATVDDLRARLDAAEAERRQLSERLAGLLPGGSPHAASPRRRWRWFRRRDR